jgi:hypothetical protein
LHGVANVNKNLIENEVIVKFLVGFQHAKTNPGSFSGLMAHIVERLSVYVRAYVEYPVKGGCV